MAKFSRLLLGGVVGAGLAYLFSRKDVRRRLMGGGQGQLPAPGAPGTNIPVTAPTPVTAPAEAPVSEAPMPEAPVSAAPAAEDLESKIEETRRQVEEQLEEPFSAPAVVSEEPAAASEEGAGATVEEAEAIVEAEVSEEPAAPEAPVSEEEIDTGEAPEILLEEEVISATGATREELEEAEAEALTEAVETNGIEVPVEKKTVELEAEKTVQFEAEAISVPESDGFADLRTPAAGEPTTAEPEVSESAPKMAAGPAPSQMDRDEMRRRIDETRARLKAKAFDALVSGETFIEPETEEGREKHVAAEVEIDSEIEEQIDRSLKEEE
ncbi:MAG: hypothetical protein ACYC4D_03365 [Thermoleophilia bacterium]